MLRFLLLAASFLSAAPAYWTQKSVGSNPVAPFTLARTDTIIARQVHDTADTLRKYARDRIHDTADTLRKYTRDRIKDSLVGIRAALPAYVRRIGDTITGPIVGTTATAAPLINITTTFGDLTNAAIRGTASAEGGAAIHGIATGINGVAIWGVSTNTGGDGGLFSGRGGANAVRAIATGGGKAGLFQGDVEVLGTTTLASSLTGILKANAGVVSVADTSDFPTRPYLPLAAGSGSPLTGVLYGQGLNFTTTANAPITISQNLAGGFTHPFQAFNSGMVAGNQYNFDFGQSASTNNAGNFGFKYVGAGSASNYVTLGLYGANDLMTITAAGVPKFSGLATAGFVRANASGQLSSSPMVAGDIPALSYQPLEDQRLSIGYSPTFASLSLSNTLVTLEMTSTVAAANGRRWRWQTSSSGALSLLAMNDAGSSGGTSMAFSRSGTTPTGATIYGGLTVYGLSGFVKATSGFLSAGSLTYADLTGAVPTWNQSTTGNAATATKWATARNLTIGSSTQAIDGTSDKTFTLAAIGAQAAGSYLHLAAGSGDPLSGTLYASASGAAIQASYGYINAQGAVVGTWNDPGAAGQYAMFQNSVLYGTTNAYALIQNITGATYLNSAAGKEVHLRINNGEDVLLVAASGNTLAGTTTLSGLAGATTRMATVNAAGQIGAVDIGQSVESRVASGSAVTVAHNTTINITSISLSAGEWDVSGQATSINGGTGNYVTNFSTGTTTTSATIPTDGTDGNSGYQTVAPNTQSTPAGTKRFVLGSTTTVYLVGKVLMSSGSGSVTAYGWISATRAK